MTLKLFKTKFSNQNILFNMITTILPFGHTAISFFWGGGMPKIDIFSVGPFGPTFVKLIDGSLTVLPNDKEMLSTDLGFKVRKKCKAQKQFS